ILDRIFEWIRIDWPRISEGSPGRASHHIRLFEDRMRVLQLAPQFAQRVEWERLSDTAGDCSQNPPVLARLPGRKHGAMRKLYAALCVDVSTVFLGVDGSRQDHIGAPSAEVAMMALVNDKCGTEVAGIDFVGAEQIENLDSARFASGQNAFDIAAPRTGNKSEIEPRNACCGRVQYIEPVPIV